MAEELNVGRLVAEIALEAETEKTEKDIKKSAENIKSTLKNSSENVEIKADTKQAETQVKKSADTIKADIQNMADNVNETVAKSENKAFTAQQKSILRFYEQNKEMYRENQEELIKAINDISKSVNMPKQALDELKEYLGLSEQIADTQSVQENSVNKKAAAYQNSAAAAENAAAREIASQQRLQNQMNRSDTALIFADLTTSLRTFNAVSPTAIGNIGTIIRQINLLRRASLSNASTVVIAATSALAVIGTITTMAVNYYTSIKEKQEEVRKKALELTESYKENIDALKSATESYIELTSKIRNNSASEAELYDNKKSLLEIQKKLIDAYGNEAAGIDLINGKFDKQIEKIDKLSQKEALLYTAKNSDKYRQAKEKLEKEDTFTVIDTSDIDTTTEEYKKLKQLLDSKYETFNTVRGLGFKSERQYAESTLVDIKEYILKMSDISEELKEKIHSTIDKSISDFPTDEINDYKNVVEAYDEASKRAEGSAKSMADNFETLKQTYENIIENISSVEVLSSAYEKLNTGEQLDNSKLIDLLDTYPKLAQYIAETGDLSLESGEKVKEAQAEILKSSIAALNQEKAYLSFKENKTAEEENLLGRVTASLSIYQEQLNKINSTSAPKLNLSDFKTAANDFGNAYKTLADNKELDLSTTLELIEKYPEFAQALNSGSNSVDGQRKAVEKLFETKKKEMLLSLQADEKELQSMINTNNSEKQALETRMQTYSMVASVVTECKLRLTELESKSKDYTDRLNQIKSQISAINNLNIENYKNTEKSSSRLNDKLQEQLKLIEHRRTLNNLTYTEEISWLQMLYREYTETAEERMQLEEKIYTAQQKSYSDLYNTQIKNLEHLKNLDRLNKEQELAWLNTLYSQYVLTAEERMSLEEKIYSVQKEIQSEREQALKNAVQSELNLLEHEKAMDRLSAENELLWLERIYNSYEMLYEDRLSMEEKVHNARKAYEAEIQKVQQETLDKKLEAIEKARSTSRITYEEELRQLRHIYRTQKLTLEQQEQLLDKIRSIQQSAESDRSSQFSKVGEGVIEALKNRYEQQRDMEEKVINDSIDNWKKWEDETVKAIQSQIDALDELANAQESEDKRREYENKRQATELLLKYEKDDYNRKQYQKEINKLDSEENKRLTEERREQQKKELQAQITAVKEQSQTQQDILNTEFEAIAKNYEKVMSSYSLENEAYKMMLSKSQNEIIDFIGSYAPEYELTGKTLGEKLYQGLRTKIKDIDYWFQQLDVKWQWYSSQTAITANQAVDRFWASRAEYERNLNSMTATPSVNLTVNFNEPVASPVQVARKMEDVTNNLVNQFKR